MEHLLNHKGQKPLKKLSFKKKKQLSQFWSKKEK